ncbi:hypothetical protein [Xenococcus sp. PCC 7305]|nr:hypothetical protein [Xenococcus sp. PCC 7305]
MAEFQDNHVNRDYGEGKEELILLPSAIFPLPSAICPLPSNHASSSGATV